MTQLGLGAMIHYLSGGSENSADKYYGRKITEARLEDNQLQLTFEDGVKIAIWDNGQSCCESRYMSTDDNIQDLVGKKLFNIQTKSGPDAEEGEYGDVHEQVFVEVQAVARTKVATVTLANHNEHNGYYGGFGLTITED